MKWIEEQQIKLKKIIAPGWKQILKVGQSEVFGLDIGSSAIKMVQLHKDDNGYIVTAAGITHIDDMTEGNNDYKNKLQNAIYQCLQTTGIQAKLAVCGVCGAESVVRCFTFPSLPPDEITSAVMLEARQVCPFNIDDDGVVDYQLISDNKPNVSGIFAAATNRLLREKARLAEDVILSSVLMDVDGLALLNCFRNCQTPENSTESNDEAGQPTAVLNVGSSYATLAIVSNDNLPFIRDLNYAGRAITENIALKNNISAKAVERILLCRENPDRIRFEISDDLETACHKLIVDVAETLRYYTAWKKSQPIEKMFVCGGFALIEEFVSLLDSQLPAAAVLWNPFDTISCRASASCVDILDKKGPAMAVAAGLAMRAI